MAKLTLKIPKLGLTITEASVIEWLASVGDTVKAGDSIVTISADKAAYEVEAPVGGVLTEILIEADEDEEHEIGTALAIIEY